MTTTSQAGPGFGPLIENGPREGRFGKTAQKRYLSFASLGGGGRRRGRPINLYASDVHRPRWVVQKREMGSHGHSRFPFDRSSSNAAIRPFAPMIPPPG